MRFGYWLPVFGGWLRNVDDEGMAATWEYARRLARRSEEIGFDLTLIAELNLNDIKGVDAPSLDAWSTAAALAAVTERRDIMRTTRNESRTRPQYEEMERFAAEVMPLVNAAIPDSPWRSPADPSRASHSSVFP